MSQSHPWNRESLKLAIVVPAYNAAQTIERTFDRISPSLGRHIVNYTVVDDGSTDHTLETLIRLRSRHENFDILQHETNKGYGAAEKTLLSHAARTAADVIVLLHADGQYAPEQIPNLLEPFVREEADIVQGSRMMSPQSALRGGMPHYKYVGNRSLTALANLVLGMRMAEYHSGMLLYSRRAVEQIPFQQLSDGFCFDQEMLVMAMVRKFKIVQRPIPTHYGDEVSHLNPIRYGLGTLSLLWAYARGHYHSL